MQSRVRQISPRVERFLERCGARTRSPDDAIEHCIEQLCQEVGGSGRGMLDRYRLARHVRPPVAVPDLEGDGAITPLGGSFDDGFRVELREGLSAPRLRFTEAHEICHTFFYELVPEVKFQPHTRDPLEEQLCNRGAAALLIPSRPLRERVAGRAASLGCLLDLAQDWGVAVETMFLRLRHLKLWDYDLSTWRRSTGGGFFSLRIYGWGQGEWNWVHEEALEKVWERGGISSGGTFVYREDPSGLSFARPIHYQVARHGNAIVALSSPRPLERQGGTMPLFTSSKTREASSRGRMR